MVYGEWSRYPLQAGGVARAWQRLWSPAAFWPTVFGRAFGTACRLSSVVCLSVCNVLYCGLYARQTADVCTYQGIFGALTPLPLCISIVVSLYSVYRQ